MAKNFSKSFKFMGFDVNLSAGKENEEEEKVMSEKYTDSKEYKESHEEVNTEETNKTANRVDLAASIFVGYGAFKLVRGVAKAFAKTKSPIGAAALLAFEGFCALYSAAEVYNACTTAREVARDVKKVVAERLKEAESDDVRE